MSPPTRSVRTMRLRDGVSGWGADRLAVEEPLEIRWAGRTLAVTMRTPGEDLDLALGFLLAERTVAEPAAVGRMRLLLASSPEAHDVVDVRPAAGTPAGDPVEPRRFTVTSACGVCGSSSVAAIRGRVDPEVREDPLRLRLDLLATLPGLLRRRQAAFQLTGGLHAAALVDAGGAMVCVREDVGRHNAVDKVVGWAARTRRLPLRGHLLLVSGRASFELVQKALTAGIPALAAVSAPSSMAVELARSAGMTLVGFLRGSTMNVYATPGRVESAAGGAPAARPGHQNGRGPGAPAVSMGAAVQRPVVRTARPWS